MDMVDFLSVSLTLSQRYAVSPTQATRHRWREDHHSEPNRPTKVPLSRTEYYRPILRENQSHGVCIICTRGCRTKLFILIQCVSHPVSGLNKRFKNHHQKPKDTSPLSAFGQMCCYYIVIVCKEGPWEGRVRGTWSVRRGCVDQHWWGEGQYFLLLLVTLESNRCLCVCCSRHAGRLTSRQLKGFMLVYYIESGPRRRLEDHHLQERPQQTVRLEDENVPDVLQRSGTPLRRNAIYSQVWMLKGTGKL